MRSRSNRGYVYLALPLIIFDVLIFFVPMIEFVQVSLHRSTGLSEVGTGYTLHNYVSMVSTPYLLHLFLNSIELIFLIALISVVIGWPISYVIARSQRWGMAVFLVIIATSFVSAVVQTIGWLVALSGSGPISRSLAAIGFEHVPLQSNSAAVVIGMVQAEIHYVVLVCVPIILLIPKDLEEAAAGLGASWARTMFSVVLPQSVSGIFAASILVMMTAAGSFTTPAILGGGLVPWFPTYIQNQMQVSLDYPMAATASVLLIVIALLLSAAAGLVSRRLTNQIAVI